VIKPIAEDKRGCAEKEMLPFLLLLLLGLTHLRVNGNSCRKTKTTANNILAVVGIPSLLTFAYIPATALTKCSEFLFE